MRSFIKALCLTLVLATTILSLGAQTRRRVLEHLVRESETVYSIAQRYATKVDKVYELNSWAKNGIKPGDKLIIYTGADYKADAPSTTPSQTPPQNPKPTPTLPKGKERQHTIEAGETLYRIARTYGLSEEQLMQANPGINAEHFPIGTVLRIPKPDSNSVTSSPITGVSKGDSIEAPEVIIRPVKLLVMLPFRKATRYLEFYQGLLMGLNDLKKDGININLTALEANDDDAVANHVLNGQVQGFDYVIGGINEEQCRTLAKATRTGHYIVPFISIQDGSSERLIQINQSPSKVIDRVIPRFIERYNGKSVVFTRRNEDADDAFSARLKRALREENIPYQTINISTTSLAMMGVDQVIVPSTPSKELAAATFASLGNNRHTPVFGYPQWQSYGDAFIRKAHEHNATFFTTFYFDKYTSEAKQFLTRFNAWYNKKVVDSYPKYSVLGYDIARYFIRANAAYGTGFVAHSSQLPSDGLQMDIELERSEEHEGYTNSRFYFVTYERDGSISRQSY
ncbi:MAG: LysM peptidoglycan-binding domain-containing protein [Porphyromonas sp.]|nr:LysM peptidoglycan-binding domain-containing protein [Porphyromonas sp.]